MHSINTAGAKTVLVTGANGFIGQSFCAEAVLRDLHVRGAVRAACELPIGAELAVVGEIGGETDWADALRGVDVVVHLAARVHVMSDTAADPLAGFLKVKSSAGNGKPGLSSRACGSEAARLCQHDQGERGANHSNAAIRRV